MSNVVRLRRVRFSQFKAFENFSCTLNQLNLLVGPNNSGKSTIISAFRALEAVLRRGKAKAADHVSSDYGFGNSGYRMNLDTLPMSVENVHRDYDASVPATITFTFTNGAEIAVVFFGDLECIAFAHSKDGAQITTASRFKATFPGGVVAVPVLGPLEHQEGLVSEQQVRRNLNSHRASRNFRSYWYHRSMTERAEFDAFAEIMHLTWPGVRLPAPPELLVRPGGGVLALMVDEERIPRELYWAGFGYQTWAQLMSHLSRAAICDLLVIDEPETYLHPDVQRQLLGLVRDRGAQAILATHSVELIGEAEPDEIVLVNKHARSGKRLKGNAATENALAALGSRRNVALSRLARTGRCVYVEGEDYRILRAIAGRIGLTGLERSVDVTDIPLGGWRPDDAPLIGRGIKEALGFEPLQALVVDRDFRSPEECEHTKANLARSGIRAAVLGRKEIENYLLVPNLIDRVLQGKARARRQTPPMDGWAETSLRRLTRRSKSNLQGRYLAARERFLRSTGTDAAVINAETLEWFDERWKKLEERLKLVSGKKLLAELSAAAQKEFKVSLSARDLVEQFAEEEVDVELRRILTELETFRLLPPPPSAR